MLEMLPRHFMPKQKLKKNSMRFVPKVSHIYFVILMVFLFAKTNSISSCVEQWTEIDLTKSEWTTVGDAKIIKSVNDNLSFEFGREDKTIEGDIGGAVWNSYDFTQKRGLLISFKPQITMDPTIFGNQKLPQGFAIVVTSSSTKNLIGTKVGGLGYEGIQNAVAFEFDFYRDADRGDYNDPHFSTHYKVNGAIAANSTGCTTLCNKPLPNFYDSDLSGYISNIVFEIQIVGKKLTVKSNHGVIYENIDFSAFQELLEQEEISIGITSTMNLNKKVTISNFKVAEIYAKEKGQLAIRSSGDFVAGNQVNIYYQLTSTCGVPLKIYYDEYSSDNFKLLINGEEVSPESRSFDESNIELKMTISETKIETYTALVEFNGHLSSPAQFTITAGSIQRFEICPTDTKMEGYSITSRLEEAKDYFIVPICSYDQYGNTKILSSFNIKVKIQYPSNLVPNSAEEYSYNSGSTIMYLKVPISIFGTYQFFSEYFVGEQIRSYELVPNSISPEKSIAGVLYDDRIISSDSSSAKVSLRIQLKDNNGRVIPKYMQTQMKCDFSSSYITNAGKKITGLTTSDLNDDNLLLSTTISSSGKYTFVPIVKCTDISEIELTCQQDKYTKENGCEIYKEVNDVNKNNVLAYSDFLDKYIEFPSSTEILLVSLDEYDNGKITDLLLLDTNGAIKHKKASVSITAKIGTNTLTVTQVANKISLSFENRKSFNPSQVYTLSLTGGVAVDIKVQFYSKNKILSNIQLNAPTGTVNYIAFYKQDSLTLKASENLLLFDLFEYYSGTTLGDGKALDASKVVLKIGSTTYNSISEKALIIKTGAFISISTHALTKAGSYQVSLSYNSKSVADINLVIEPHDTVYQLGDSKGVKLDSTTYTMASDEVRQLTLLDKYENVLTNKQLFPAFASIKKSYSSSAMKVKANYDGMITIVYNGKARNELVNLTLINSKTYTFKSITSDDTFKDVDTYQSYAILTSNYNITAAQEVKLTLYLVGKYGNKLQSKIDPSLINVYAQGRNNKEIAELTTSDTSVTVNGLSYKGFARIEGDYDIKVFINNFPIECKGCNFKVNRLVDNASSNIRLYVLGNKKKYPLFTKNTNSQIILKEKSLVFFVQFNDAYGNEFTQTKTLSSMTISGPNNARVSLCTYSTKAEDKGYYKVCSGSESKYASLEDGIYNIKIDTNTYYFYLVNSIELDTTDTTPSSSNSMIMQYDKTIYGKTNAPGFFILDLRNSNNKRISGLDKSKVTISNTNVKISVMNGPETGLLTVFLKANTPGKYTFTVKYNSVQATLDEYTYISGCSIKSISYKSVSTLTNGYYAFYTAVDLNGMSCKSIYGWNEFDEKETFANLAITAQQTEDTSKIFRPKVYYNHLSGIVTLYFDNHVSGSLTLKSDVVTISSDSTKIDIPSKVTDKDHFYVTLNKGANEVKVSLLNDNYEKIAMSELNTADFKLAIIREINDDIVTISNNLSAKTDFSFTYDSGLLDAAGKYLFVVYYKGDELFCENCMLEVTSDTVEMANTKVYHKEGNNLYYADSSDFTSNLVKSNFPFFKVNLYSKKNNMVILSSSSTSVSATLKAGSTVIETKIKITPLGNIYIYLTSAGRTKYLSLNSMTTLTLTITYSSTNTYSVEYLLLNNYLETPTSREKCNKGSDITIVDSQSSYITRADSSLELEVNLEGCADELLNIQSSSEFKVTIGESSGTVEAIPTDTYGGYILLISSSKAAPEAQTAIIGFKSSITPEFKLTVNPGYDIDKIAISSETYLSEPSSNNKYTYVLIEMTDTKGNTITNMGRNLFAADYFCLTISDENSNNLPYKISYNEGLKKSIVQIPVSGNGKVTIKIVKDSTTKQIEVPDGKFYTKSLFEFSKEESTNTYSFTLTARDAFYKKIASPTGIQTVSFKYFTISAFTEEVFTKVIKAQSSSGKYILSVPSNYPKYQIYGFIPYINSIEQECSSCIFKTPLPSVIYTLDTKTYVPHSIMRKMYFTKGIDTPVFVYASENTVTFSPNQATAEKLISTGSSTSITAFETSESSFSIKITAGTLSQTFNGEIVEYTTETLARNEAPAITERYGLNSYINNMGDLASVSFFMELRNEAGALLKLTNVALYSNANEQNIGSINVYTTIIEGVYYVNIKLAKSGEIEYSLKFKEDTATDADKEYNTLQINEISSFPVSLVLDNKKKITNNLITYDVIATNQDSETICDDRINLFTIDSSLLGNKILYKEDDICKIALQFAGDLTLNSTVEGFSSELSNDDNSVDNINPHSSGLTISPNVFKSLDNELIISFNEISTFGHSFAENEKTLEKRLNVYKYYTPTKYELVKNMNGLYSTTYNIKAKSFNMELGNVYAFIVSLDENNLPPSLVHYSKNTTITHVGFNAQIITGNGINKKITNFGEKRSSSGATVEMNYPFSFKFQVLNNDQTPITLTPSDLSKLTVKIAIAGITSTIEDYSISLLVRPINENTFIAEVPTDQVLSVIHAPLSLQSGRNYYLDFTYLKKYISLLSHTKDHYQSPNMKEGTRQYSYGNDKSTIESFYIYNEKKTTDAYFPFGIDTIQQVCFYNNSASLFYNQNIDISKLTVSLSGSGASECKVAYMNSYLGCIALTYSCTAYSSTATTVTFKYNNVENSNKFSVKLFNSNSPAFDNVKSTEDSYGLSSQMVFSFSMTSGGSVVTGVNNNYFDVFVNGEQLTKNQFTLTSDSTAFKLNIDSSYSNTVAKSKQVMLLFNDNVSGKVKITSSPATITITQPDYAYSSDSTKFKYRIQVPIDIVVGQKLKLYLLVKDTNQACYYGDSKKLENIKAKILIEGTSYTSTSITPTSLTGISSCEKVYLLGFDDSSKYAGEFDISLYDGSNRINPDNIQYSIYINHGELDPSHCTLKEGASAKAGSRFEIYFTGADSNGNEPNYFDIVDNLEMEFTNKETGQKVNFGENDYDKYASVDNTKIVFGITIENTGTYEIKLKYKNGYLTGFKGTQETKVIFGECSFTGADPQITMIDGRNEFFYSGEEISINLQCKDDLGNPISARGNEVFSASIKLEGSQSGISYDLQFISGKYYFIFTPTTNGVYTADITLNGKKYGDKTLTFEVKNYDYNQYMCMDKRQFNRMEQCENTEYIDFITDLLGKENICTPAANGAMFKCPGKGNCVVNTVDCACQGNEYNGYCYPKDMDPIAKKNDKKVTCKITMMNEGIYNHIIECNDGSCRTDQKECDTKFECPVGYKSCANSCILLNEECKLTNQCQEDEVICWDMSCASDYSHCPTRISCPSGKYLCPDKTCKEHGKCVQPNVRTCPDGEVQCPDFSCVRNLHDCSKNIICEAGESLCEDGSCRLTCEDVVVPEGQVRCKSGAYVTNIQLCPTEVFQPDNYFKCSNGGISKTKLGCDYIQGGNKITCPKTKPILCPDFECVVQSSDCNPNVPECPTHKPYQCWNNECRKSFDECPTQVTCPDDTPILCSSGFCASSADECQEVKETDCPKYRCFDGTCVQSMELCPTHTYCGIYYGDDGQKKNAVKCWNGACVSKVMECPSSNFEISTSFEASCPDKYPFRCPDGSCRPNKSSCSTISVCPSSLPIKCFDNSCRANTNECPNFQTCGEHKVSCPDGTCAKTLAECNTGITCYSDKPYLCYDGSCAKEISECPESPFCQKSEVLCPNGVCTSSRQNCKVFDACLPDEPIRCEMNTCTESVDKCSTKQKRCPIGYSLCANGDCRTSETLCDEFICPKNLPYKCPEGVCVSDKQYCDNQENGCPYNAPNKCPDGTCLSDFKNCNKNFTCPENTKMCLDGSCIKQKEECPTINGCYADRPYKCADGTCINPETTNCSLALCPVKYPFKCPNGNCVSRSSECSTELQSQDKEDCEKDGLIMCVDGRCVPSTDYCRPYFDCETGYTRCSDGSCRVSLNLCPQNVQCPETRPYRCTDSDMKCVKDQKDCINGLKCPSGYIRCSTNGECVNENSNCPDAKTPNGCPEGKIKCYNGRCLRDLAECNAASNACPDDSKPYLCSNGECIDDKNDCPAYTPSPEKICPGEKESCTSGRCVQALNETKRVECTNAIGCPLYKPYRCSNGKCVSRETECEVNSAVVYGSDTQYISNIVCDVSKPYLCGDKSCVSDISFCKTSLPCTGGVKCPNGICVDDSKKCQNYLDYCPIAAPIQCPSGTCAQNIVECAPSFNIPSCNEGEFYCTRTAKCETKKKDCLIYYDMSEIIKTSFSRRLFEDNFNPVSFIEEDGKEEKEKKGVLCYDGTVAATGEKCPIVPGCKMGQYRCRNGGCASDLSLCHDEEDLEDFSCPDGQMKCPDGFCHSDCKAVAYHGCLVGQYQCSNGLCVKDEHDCIGYSMCENPEYPFRCIDGTCKESPSECPLIKRLGSIQNMTYTFNRINKAEFSFALDNNGRTLASIQIPGNGLSIGNSKADAYGKLYIEEVSSSILYDSGLYNDSAAFLFNLSNSVIGSDGVLTFENSVMSPVFKFYTKEKGINFEMSGVISIIHNYYDASGINYTDYCLARLNGFDLDKDVFTGEVEDRYWECVQRKENDDQTDFKINKFGVYAVILNPLRNKINYFGDSEERNFFLENIKMILIVFGIIVVVLALVFYIFFRVTRYREKYHENRNKILLLQQQKQEYENMTTDIFGQTLGDNINGIVYKSNPCYSITEEIKTRDTSLEEEIEKLQIQCKNVTDQNARLQTDIDELTEKYKILSNSIENMAK